MVEGTNLNVHPRMFQMQIAGFNQLFHGILQHRSGNDAMSEVNFSLMRFRSDELGTTYSDVLTWVATWIEPHGILVVNGCHAGYIKYRMTEATSHNPAFAAMVSAGLWLSSSSLSSFC